MLVNFEKDTAVFYPVIEIIIENENELAALYRCFNINGSQLNDHNSSDEYGVPKTNNGTVSLDKPWKAIRDIAVEKYGWGYND